MPNKQGHRQTQTPTHRHATDTAQLQLTRHVYKYYNTTQTYMDTASRVAALERPLNKTSNGELKPGLCGHNLTLILPTVPPRQDSVKTKTPKGNPYQVTHPLTNNHKVQ